MSFIPPVDWPSDLPTWEDVKLAFERDCPDGFFEMQLVGADASAAVKVWNMGIDSRLEAITAPSRHYTVDNAPLGTKLGLALDCKGLLVFVRRLWEINLDEPEMSEETEEALSLARTILASLDLEVV